MIPCIPIWMTMSTLHINQSSCGVKISYLVPCNGRFLIGGKVYMYFRESMEEVDIFLEFIFFSIYIYIYIPTSYHEC